VKKKIETKEKEKRKKSQNFIRTFSRRRDERKFLRKPKGK
jgi:hypothetical protein